MDKPNANKHRNALVGVAGVHYVVSELSRRGLIALPTVRNVAAYDVIAATQDGRKHANIQVKASSKCALFFPMPEPHKIRTGPRDVYVFVRWVEKEKRYQGFLVKGRQARQAVDEAIANQQASIDRGTRTKPFPCVYVGAGTDKRSRRWERAWLTWGL